MAGYLRSKRCERMSRRVSKGLADLDRRDSYHVYDGEGVERGSYPSLSEARGCVEFDGLAAYSIVKGDWDLIEQVAA
jgi:hypothetical protein